MKKLIWSDDSTIGPRFNQTGYSAPTVFPEAHNYKDLSLYAIDLVLAEKRQGHHLDWVWEEYAEARLQYLEEQAEAKAEREEMYEW